jgi:hypothetical protein
VEGSGDQPCATIPRCGLELHRGTVDGDQRELDGDEEGVGQDQGERTDEPEGGGDGATLAV